jgi:hypothetical protein
MDPLGIRFDGYIVRLARQNVHRSDIDHDFA